MSNQTTKQSKVVDLRYHPPPTVLDSACWHEDRKRLYYTRAISSEFGNTLYAASIHDDTLVTETENTWTSLTKLYGICDVKLACQKLYAVTMHPGKFDLWEVDIDTLCPKTLINTDFVGGWSFSMTICGDEKHLLLASPHANHPLQKRTTGDIYVMKNGNYTSKLVSEFIPPNIQSMLLYRDMLFITAFNSYTFIVGLKWNPFETKAGQQIWGPIGIYSMAACAITPSGTLMVSASGERKWLFFDTNELSDMSEPIRSEEIEEVAPLHRAAPIVACSDKLVATQYGLRRLSVQ